MADTEAITVTAVGMAVTTLGDGVGPDPGFISQPSHIITRPIGTAAFPTTTRAIRTSPGSYAGQYRTVAPPAGAPDSPWGGAVRTDGLSEERAEPYQQSTDRYECYRWAISQLGYDPTSAGGATVRRDLTDYNRAQTACLTARGYSVK